MSYVGTIPCAQATYLPGVVSGTTPLSLVPGGLGCGSNGDCGCGCGGHGVAGLTMDGSGLFGTGIFGSSVSMTDVATWTWGEWAVVGVAAFATLSVLDTMKRAGQRVARTGKAVRKGVSGVRKAARSKK